MVTQYNTERPWERQPCDTEIGWLLFQDYLALPRPRSIRALSHKGGPLSWTQLETLAWENGWTLRAALYDGHLDRLRQETIEKEVQETAKETAKRHVRQARKAVALAGLELDKLLDAAKQSPMPGIISPRDVIRFLALGIRSERLALGDATDVVENRVDLSKFNAEELRELRKLQEKAGGTE
jgi:hypothetical protein